MTINQPHNDSNLNDSNLNDSSLNDSNLNLNPGLTPNVDPHLQIKNENLIKPVKKNNEPSTFTRQPLRTRNPWTLVKKDTKTSVPNLSGRPPLGELQPTQMPTTSTSTPGEVQLDRLRSAGLLPSEPSSTPDPNHYPFLNKEAKDLFCKAIIVQFDLAYRPNNPDASSEFFPFVPTDDRERCLAVLVGLIFNPLNHGPENRLKETMLTNEVFKAALQELSKNKNNNWFL